MHGTAHLLPDGLHELLIAGVFHLVEGQPLHEPFVRCRSTPCCEAALAGRSTINRLSTDCLDDGHEIKPRAAGEQDHADIGNRKRDQQDQPARHLRSPFGFEKRPGDERNCRTVLRKFSLAAMRLAGVMGSFMPHTGARTSSPSGGLAERPAR